MKGNLRQSWILDSTPWIPDTLSAGTWILDPNRKGDSGFLELHSGFQSPRFQIPQPIVYGFRIPQAKTSQFWNPKSLTWDKKIILNTLIGLNEVNLCANLNVSNTVDGRLYIRHFSNSNLLFGNLQHNKHF